MFDVCVTNCFSWNCINLKGGNEVSGGIALDTGVDSQTISKFSDAVGKGAQNLKEAYDNYNNNNNNNNSGGVALAGNDRHSDSGSDKHVDEKLNHQVTKEAVEHFTGLKVESDSSDEELKLFS